MHRQFFKILSQNPEYVRDRCEDLNNLFQFAIRKWMIKQEIDIDENWYGNSLSQCYQKDYH